MPLISVVIPAHNAAPFVAEAVRSVLAQTFRDFELIVVDDGSSDGTGDVLKEFAGRIEYIHQANRGASAARNAGIQAAKGRYVCFLDADDSWHADKLEQQIRFMQEHPELGLSFADGREQRDGRVTKESILAATQFHAELTSEIPIRNAFSKLLLENFIPTPSVIVSADCLRRVGLFDENLPVAEDRDMWLRIAAHSAIACLHKPLITVRKHDSNISNRRETTLRARLRVWSENRRRFPTLAPRHVYYPLLARTYQDLGYIVLTRGAGREARRYGVASLRSALSYTLTTGSLFPFRWTLAFALIPLTFAPWSLVRWVWQTRNVLFGWKAPVSA
jgi:glycosyltransferase involved in cell wall biosynthesis